MARTILSRRRQRAQHSLDFKSKFTLRTRDGAVERCFGTIFRARGSISKVFARRTIHSETEGK
ncbi:hypothetical protein N1F89_12695 [Aquibium sp. A9E412]|uniref:hypothetical protein n=1 Tax=Aquibium sp. A9E412 TaxID=2976767 RepID=UPI0025AFECC3|nr:hypothetical protein [Aquibium sp. A9E412]MDN2567081.1 hypothetical protein [Aquibium sp. A9E412]